MPSMIEAASIRDHVERHAYVFRNELTDRGFFDVEQRRQSEEFSLLSERIADNHSVLEIGCLTGLNLILLAERGVKQLHGIEFVREAVEWLNSYTTPRGLRVTASVGSFPGLPMPAFDRIICADVLEHQLNVGRFLDGVRHHLKRDGKALFIIPAGREYFDCGHTAFWPDADCLANTLGYFFDAVDIRLICDGRKFFAVCQQVDR